jgi:hypothetical protein
MGLSHGLVYEIQNILTLKHPQLLGQMLRIDRLGEVAVAAGGQRLVDIGGGVAVASSGSPICAMLCPAWSGMAVSFE